MTRDLLLPSWTDLCLEAIFLIGEFFCHLERLRMRNDFIFKPSKL